MYANLKLQLFKIGMRQNRLAQSLGMDETILSKIVNGFREPSQPLREKIAALLQSNEEWLFERTGKLRDPADRPVQDVPERSATRAKRYVAMK